MLYEGTTSKKWISKPKIALLISGRATCWEVCLKNVLEKSNNYDIDLFMSINSSNKDCKYFKLMRDNLSLFLKGLYINEYKVPDDFVNTSNDVNTVKQLVDNKYVPLNILSMWFNYNNAFKMACDYQTKNNFEYDLFMTFRSDIIIEKIPLFKNLKEDVLHSINQPCQFISFGIYKERIISPEWVYARKNIMSKYLETYDYIIEQSKINNNYICHYESNVTDNCISKGIKVERISNIKYSIDANRRRFDDWEKVKDTRVHNIANRDKEYSDINQFNESSILVYQKPS